MRREKKVRFENGGIETDDRNSGVERFLNNNFHQLIAKNSREKKACEIKGNLETILDSRVINQMMNSSYR